MPPTMRPQIEQQLQCTETQSPRQPVVTVTRKLCPVWDLTADELFDVWMQCILCMSVDPVSGVYNSCELQVTWRKGYHHRDIRQANLSRRRLSWVSPMTGVLQLAITSLLRPLPTRTVQERYHLWHYSCFPSRTRCICFGMMRNHSSGCSFGCVAALMGQERKFLWLRTRRGGIWKCSLEEKLSFRLFNWRTSTSLPTMRQTATFACSWRSCCNNCARTSGWTSRQTRITMPRRISHYWRRCSFQSSRRFDLRLTRGFRQVIGLAKSVVLRFEGVSVALWPQLLIPFGEINFIRIGHFPSIDACAQAALRHPIRD